MKLKRFEVFTLHFAAKIIKVQANISFELTKQKLLHRNCEKFLCCGHFRPTGNSCNKFILNDIKIQWLHRAILNYAIKKYNFTAFHFLNDFNFPRLHTRTCTQTQSYTYTYT